MKGKDDCPVCQMWLSEERSDLNPCVGDYTNPTEFPMTTTIGINLPFSELIMLINKVIRTVNNLDTDKFCHLFVLR